MGRDRARTITNEDVAITFATPAGEAAWQAAVPVSRCLAARATS